MGDGEMGEPESLGAIRIAAREGLDNLTYVINCNLQQLDGPVLGNGKIVQELESFFLGAGWHVIKVLWGRDWDPLLAADKSGALINKMNTTPDGQFQTYLVEDGAYIRNNFFADPRLQRMVANMSDEEIKVLSRGGHDYRKVYAAFKAASRARRPADGDPGPDGQGLDDRRAGGQERHPPDEEADQQGPQDASATGSTWRSPTASSRTRTTRPTTTRARTTRRSSTCRSDAGRSGATYRSAGSSRRSSSCRATRCTRR